MSGATPHGAWVRTSAVLKEGIPRTTATVVRRALRSIGDRQPVKATIGSVDLDVHNIRCVGTDILVQDAKGAWFAADTLEITNPFGATERYRRQA